MQNDFQLGKWLVKPNSNEIISTLETQKLEHIVMQLLVFFANNSDRDLPKEEILKGVWGNGVFNEEVLTVAVSSLRKALGDNPQSPEYLKTLPPHRLSYAQAASNAKDWFYKTKWFDFNFRATGGA